MHGKQSVNFLPAKLLREGNHIVVDHSQKFHPQNLVFLNPRNFLPFSRFLRIVSFVHYICKLFQMIYVWQYEYITKPKMNCAMNLLSSVLW